MLRSLVLLVSLVTLGSSPLWAGTPTIWPVEPGVRTEQALGGRLKVRLMPGIQRGAHEAVLRSMGLRPLYPMLPWEQSVTARQGKGADEPLNTAAKQREILRLEEPLLRTYVVAYDNPMPPEKMAHVLRPGCSHLEVCEPVYLDRLFAEPDDPLVTEQAMLETIRAFEGWDIEAGSETIIIGISDSGVLQEHEDLYPSLYRNRAERPQNGKDDDGNGFIDDYEGYNLCTEDDGTDPGYTFNKTEGHGTGVAGICGATVNNGIGVAGVANACRIFPLKTMPDNIPGIVYGYESIMYCALNGIHVVNCSWGGSSKSCINESVIAYAVARNVAIVAAAGNHGTSAPFYPASYTDVLSVGVTDPDDNVIGMTGHGPTVDIMAPGQRTYTTGNDGTYGGFCCTSGSSPIVAAVVALVLSRSIEDGQPTLTGREACGIVAAMADPVEWNSVPGNVDPRLLPLGRVDVVRSLTPDVDEQDIEILGIRATSTANDTRWAAGDTVRVEVDARNVLSPFHLDRLSVDELITPVIEQALQIQAPSSVIIDRAIAVGEAFTLPPVDAVVLRDSDTTEFIATTLHTIDSEGGQQSINVDIRLTPAPAFRTLSNDVLTLSVGDRCRIGNTDLSKGQGDGVTYKEFCGQLYEGGLMVTANGRVVDGVRGVRQTNDHFRPAKRFTRPDRLTGVATDADAPDSIQIGVEVTQTVRIADADSGLFVTDMTIRNVSDETMTELSAGWFYDWDLGLNPIANTTALHSAGAREAIQRIGSTVDGEPVVLIASFSLEEDATPISAGLNNTLTYGGISPETKREYLTSGTRLQYDRANDVAAVSGMAFTMPLAPGQERTFRHVIAIDTDLQRAQALVDAARRMQREQHPVTFGPVRPNPATTIARVDVPLNAGDRVVIADLQGRLVRTIDDTNGEIGTITIDCTSLATGVYQVRLVTATGDVQTTGLMVVR